MKIHSCLRLLRQHTCLLFTIACAPPCGDSIITPLLAVPIALCRIAAGARGKCLHTSPVLNGVNLGLLAVVLVLFLLT